MFKKVLLLLLILAMPIVIFAQSSGKLIGVVTDKDTGEPLPGVNVILQDTYLGGTTDVEGYFIILNVPVGVFTVEASYVGYTNMIVQNVRVSADVTTEQDFQLSSTTLELGEAVVVVAERPLVEKHVTQSVSKITSEQIKDIPVRGVAAILALQPSVVAQDGNIYIRGGRADEVGYYLDGASTTSPLNNLNQTHVIQDATEEIQVLTGGYTAQYGNANAGIVRSELKSGGPKFHVSVDAQTDKFAGEGEQFLNTYSYREHVIAATISGPIVENIRFFLAYENHDWGDTQKRFSTGYTFDSSNLENLLIDTNPSNPANDPANANFNPDTLGSISYLDGFTPKNWQKQHSFNGTMLFDFDQIKFRLSSVVTMVKDYQITDPMRDVFNNREQPREGLNALISGKFTHVINPSTYYDLKVNYFYDSSERTDDYFGNDWRAWSDSAKIAEHTNGAVIYRDQTYQQFSNLINGFNFWRDGTLRFNYLLQKQSYIGGELDFVSQMGKHHEVQAGADMQYWTIRRYSVNPTNFLRASLDYNGEENIPEGQYARILGNTYGYDFYGNELDSGFDGAKHPLFFSGYLQDKVEYDDLIINAGLRLDYFDTQDRGLKNPANLVIDDVKGVVAEDEWVTKDPIVFVSPRLGVSFPVSDKTVFYTQYGQFVQMPSFDSFYFSSLDFGDQLVGGNYFITPVGYDIDPMYTTSYEIGFRQQVGESFAFDITGFYKNIKGQLQAGRIVPEPGATIQSYNVIQNGDFATTKGLEVKLILRRIQRLQALLNYTYSQAEGTGSNSTSYLSATDRQSARPTVLMPLDFNQTHRGTINLDYRFGENDGGAILENLGANVLFNFASGHPFTRVITTGSQAGAYDIGVDYMDDTRSRQAVEPINSSTTPWEFNFDLKVDKSFNIMDNLTATVYFRVLNLLNTKTPVNVFEVTGSAENDGFLSGQMDPTQRDSYVNANGGKDYETMYKAINLTNGQAYWSQIGRQLYNHPRQIFFGIKFAY